MKYLLFPALYVISAGFMVIVLLYALIDKVWNSDSSFKEGIRLGWVISHPNNVWTRITSDDGV